jgi:hypothetical protein
MAEPVTGMLPREALGLSLDVRRQLFVQGRRILLKAAALTACDVCPGVWDRGFAMSVTGLSLCAQTGPVVVSFLFCRVVPPPRLFLSVL